MTVRLADEDGFTLVELLVAMMVGLVVIFAAFSVMDGSWRVHARTADYLDTTDRGRRAMDRVTQALGSRTCLTSSVPAQGAFVTETDDMVEFYATVTSDTAPRLVVERRRLTYQPGPQNIELKTWTGSAPPPTAPPAATTTATLTTRVIAEGIEAVPGTPVFRYYVPTGTPPLPTLIKAPPISDADANAILLVKVNFRAIGKRPGVRTEFQNDSLTRSPTCPF